MLYHCNPLRASGFPYIGYLYQRVWVYHGVPNCLSILLIWIGCSDRGGQRGACRSWLARTVSEPSFWKNLSRVSDI